MNEVARVYAESLFEVALEHDKLDEIHDQLGEFVDALDQSRDLSVFFFSPHFTSVEKREGIDKVLDDADPELVNFLKLLVEKHRMAAVHRIRSQFNELWREEHKLLDVNVTSAVDLDDDLIERIRSEIEEQTDRRVNLTSQVDESIIGGLVLKVGNMVLDASLRNRLDRFRKQMVRAGA